MKRTSSLFAIIVMIIASVVSFGCAQLKRSSDSGYAYRNYDQDVRRDRRPKLSSIERAEKGIEGRLEKEQYYKNKAYLKNDRERLEFLQLGSFEARSSYLDQKGIDGNATAHPPEIQALVEINDITVGMTKQAVRDSWGEPELVEVAGNPLYGNERWHYNEQISSTEGYQTERRLVYFEAGRVVGWQTR